MPGAGTSLTFDIFARDQASATFRRLGEQASGASDNVQRLSERLDKIGQRAVNARVGIEGDKEANANLDKITARLTTLNRKVANPDVTLEGAAKMRAEISSLELDLDRLGQKTARPNVALSKVGALSFLQPSVLGAAAAMLPALIPLAGQAAVAVGAIGISFAAAGAAAAAFGLMAGTVLAGTSKDLAKLQALNVRLNEATTKAQRDAVRKQIAALLAGWSAGYRDLIGSYEAFQAKWKRISQEITVPALTTWIDTLTRGMQFLVPALKPVADLFQGLGESLNATLANNAPRVKELAAAFGRFSATQLADVARFITDIAKGIFNLGKDLAANGANFGAAGTWLAGIGDGFLTWSKSASARRDVRGFMKWIHDEGPVVKNILKDLAEILPGIFVGATTVGALELKALGNFLNLVAKLPKGWQAGLTEFAGTMLLLSKIGVVKVGLKLVGLEGALAIPGLAGAGSAGGPFALAGAAMVAGFVLEIRKDLKKDIPALGHDIANALMGLGGFAAGAASGLGDVVASHFEKTVRKGFSEAWHAVTASAAAFFHDMVDSFHAFTGKVGASLSADRRLIASAWDTIWRNTITRVQHGISDVMDWFGRMRHNIATSLAADRHDIASAWDTIWRNTITRVQNGIDDVVGWFKRLPGRVIGALWGLGSHLYAFAHAALNDFLRGLKSIAGAVFSWVGHFVSTIWNKVKSFFKIGSPSGLFYDIGKNLMLGLFHGIKDHAHKAQGAIGGAVGGLGGPSSASARQAQAYARSRLGAYGWGGAQMGPLIALWNQESGWNRLARNPSSGAYGIPQALPPGKMGAAANPPTSSAAAQINWGLSYIRGRYGSPAGAWAHEQRFNWYAGGTRSALPGWAVVGERGPELVKMRGGERVYPAQAGRGRSAGGHVTVRFDFSRSHNHQLADIIREAVRVQGGGDVQVALGTSH